MRAPIIVFAYNRPMHIMDTLNALSGNALAKESDLFIFCDGPKKDKDISVVEEVRDVVDRFRSEKKDKFKSVTVYFSCENNGLAKSIIEHTTEILQQYKRVIVLEDDLITSADFLTYMNNALEYYQSNKNVWSISGFTPNVPGIVDYPHDVYMVYRGCSWGWATWLDRWQQIDWEVKDYKRFLIDPWLRNRFARSGGADLPGMLDMQMKGMINSWAIRWNYQQFKLNKYSVYPKYSRILNTGVDGSGTHKVVSDKYAVTLNANTTCTFEDIEPDKVIQEAFCSIYKSSRWNRLKQYIKHNILLKK